MGKVKQWFHSLPTEEVQTWKKCSNVFLAKFFPLGRTNMRNKISNFHQYPEESIAMGEIPQHTVVHLAPLAFKSQT